MFVYLKETTPFMYYTRLELYLDPRLFPAQYFANIIWMTVTILRILFLLQTLIKIAFRQFIRLSIQ
jgi:hypothetical protein